MTFFSVLLALFFEQFHALGRHNPVHAFFRRYAAFAELKLDAGEARHGRLAWWLVVLPPAVLVALIHVALLQTSFLLAALWNITMVYLTMGFRQFSHYFTNIHKAQDKDNLPAARELLAEWTGMDTTEMAAQDIARHTLERAILAAHRHVFGVFFWFLVPIGPAGVVIYRIAGYLAREWDKHTPERSPTLGLFAQKAFHVIDWVPARLTSIGFAIVGNFEDAVYAWRNYASRWGDRSEGVLLAAGAGALGVRLGPPQAERSSEEVLAAGDDNLIEIGEETSARALQSAVGLVWRAVILWMLLLAMLSVAVWLG
ncbi:MAG: CobD/CbiB family protein [Candidatus Protistobacter heckmanni]|nr:CobD/CbiB family protein [Candidatus Protistobacter heckmanni]